jgi:hypothetical protein
VGKEEGKKEIRNKTNKHVVFPAVVTNYVDNALY